MAINTIEVIYVKNLLNIFLAKVWFLLIFAKTNYLITNNSIKHNYMKSFLKTLFASFIGVILAIFIGMFILISVFGAMIPSSETNYTLPKSAILRIDSTFGIGEQDSDPNIDIQSIIMGNPSTGAKTIGILTAIKAIEKAATDPTIKFIYINPSNIALEKAHLEELRNALLKFKSSGKAIISYCENYSQDGYYLASVSDKLYVHPYGGNMVFGLNTSLLFFKDALEKFGVEIQLIRHGKYKSAGEQFVNSQISEANREQNQAMINSLWNTLSTDICESREIELSTFNKYINNLSATTPKEMVEKKMADGIYDRIEMLGELMGLFGVNKEADLKMVTLDKYAKAVVKPNYKAKDKIAIIYANGQISQGDGNGLTSDRYSKIISDVKKDSTIKAVLLRVNSPGGDAVAAEIIRKELASLKEKKPVIVSYGPYAASGGYWISAEGDKIFSDETTLTGSIGVFSMIPNFQKIIKEKLRVNVVDIKSNDHASLLSSMITPLDKKEVEYMQNTVEFIYDSFINIVANGRNMTTAEVDKIGQGRVWSGSDGLKVGLVDEIGGISDALEYIENTTGLSNYMLVEYPKPQTSLDRITQMLGQTTTAVEAISSPSIGVEKLIKSLKDEQRGVYARMEYDYIFN